MTLCEFCDSCDALTLTLIHPLPGRTLFAASRAWRKLYRVKAAHARKLAGMTLEEIWDLGCELADQDRQLVKNRRRKSS